MCKIKYKYDKTKHLRKFINIIQCLINIYCCKFAFGTAFSVEGSVVGDSVSLYDVE